MLKSIFSSLLHFWQKYQLRRLYSRVSPLRKSAGTVIFWIPGGMPLMLHLEGAIAAALKLRGIDVHAVICDGPFKACVTRDITNGMPVNKWQETCAKCKTGNSYVLDMMGVKYSYIGDYVTEETKKCLWKTAESITWDTVSTLYYEDINIGKNVQSSIIRYLKGNSLAGHEEIVREYAFSGLVAAAAAAEAFKLFLPSRIYMSHGTYVDWGPALQTALIHKIPVTAWMASYLKTRFYFRNIEDPLKIDFHDISRRAWTECKNTVLSPQQAKRLDNFMVDRYKKQINFDMKKFNETTGDTDKLRKSYMFFKGKPVWGIISHINWDAVSDYSPMAYETFDEWMLDTIREIIQITDVNWLIKIHPAEAWNNPESGIQKLIFRHFPSLPPHIRLLSAEEDINPYDFFKMVDGGITVYGTAGLELSLQGKPIILAGEAHYGDKGFTYDGSNVDTYRQLLRKAGTLKPLTEEQRQMARRYAYCYFIQRQVPFPVVKDPESTWWKFQFNKRELLLPGKDSFVDFICDRIMDGKDFIMDEKLVALSEENW